MTIDDKITDGNYNTVLTEKLQKCQHFHLETLINMNILQVKEYYLPIEDK